MNIRLLITGSRSWDNIDYIRSVFTALSEYHEGQVTLVSGACPTGADRLGEIVAEELGWDIELYPADWNTHGRKAGFVRNSQMIDTVPDMVVGFVRNGSKGASMTVNLGKKKGLFTVVHTWTDYPYTCYSSKNFNEPDSSSSSNENLDEGMLF